jgi:membrane protein YdbS with pleckstrin-like domain
MTMTDWVSGCDTRTQAIFISVIYLWTVPLAVAVNFCRFSLNEKAVLTKAGDWLSSAFTLPIHVSTTTKWLDGIPPCFSSLQEKII